MATSKKIAGKTTKPYTVRKTAAKKSSRTIAAKKAAPAKKRAVKRAALDLKPIRNKMTKSELANYLAEQVGVERKVVLGLFTAMADTMKASVMPRGCGEFQVPGVVAIRTKKIKAKKVAAIKPGTLVRNPRTGEEVPHKGRKASIKPAYTKVRAVALGGLKRAALGTE